MIYSSLDSSRRDESNGSKIIPIRAIFVEIAIFQKFQVRSGRVNCITRPDISGRVGYPNLGSKFGALNGISLGILWNHYDVSTGMALLLVISIPLRSNVSTTCYQLVQIYLNEFPASMIIGPAPSAMRLWKHCITFSRVQTSNSPGLTYPCQFILTCNKY